MACVLESPEDSLIFVCTFGESETVAPSLGSGQEAVWEHIPQASQ